MNTVFYASTILLMAVTMAACNGGRGFSGLPEPTQEDIETEAPVARDINFETQPIEENNAESDIVVDGSCLGKKKAGVILIDIRDKDKTKTKSVVCKNDKFVIKFLEKKKDHPFLQVQAVFF